ncbi:hypothetical protein [Algibacter sp. 2305UL17-15]|uniref:hypothetical protein n=1 Tax=Algibacter sp. 2305UL17-15 TaxID=3231268 RepID=UPI003457FCDA
MDVLNKIKEAKEMLDLGTINQIEFDKIKHDILTQNENTQNISFKQLEINVKKGNTSKNDLDLLRNQKKITALQYASLLEIYNRQNAKRISFSQKVKKFLSYDENIVATDREEELNRKTEPFAIVTFICGIGIITTLVLGRLIPIIFILIIVVFGYISSIVSYFKLKEDIELKGGGIRVIGAIFIVIGSVWIMENLGLINLF